MTDYIEDAGRRYAVTTSGEKILVGMKTIQERNAYVRVKTKQYMEAHPGVLLRYAKRQARIRWAKKVRDSYPK